jgi:endonuclease/exonuclease/phosphatase family metal-dependent hydrolase
LPVFDAELPGIGRDIRLTDHEVILVRTGLPEAEFQGVNVSQGYFINHVELTFPFVGKVPYARGWVAVDAKVRGKPFRFLSTHLEPAASDPVVQFLQAGELLAGPADTDLPMILVGDFNSSAEPHPIHGTPTYELLLDAAFVDAWSVARPGEPGYTRGQAELLDNEDSLADARIDFVFVRNGTGPGRGRARRPDIDVLDADVAGDIPADITDSVRWASDHFGVVAGLRLLP